VPVVYILPKVGVYNWVRVAGVTYQPMCFAICQVFGPNLSSDTPCCAFDRALFFSSFFLLSRAVFYYSYINRGVYTFLIGRTLPQARSMDRPYTLRHVYTGADGLVDTAATNCGRGAGGPDAGAGAASAKD
jgi:hypothetical protein